MQESAQLSGLALGEKEEVYTISSFVEFIKESQITNKILFLIESEAGEVSIRVQIENKDESAAKELLSTYKKSFASVSDQIVNNSISGNQTFQTQNQAAAVTLYSRYLKRVGAHLKNIVTTVVNPYEYIGFKTPKQL